MFDASWHLLFLSTGQYWTHSLSAGEYPEYQWNESHVQPGIQPYLLQFMFPPPQASQFSHETVRSVSPQPGPSFSSLETAAATFSQSSEGTEGESRALVRWSRADVLLLISCYVERRERFKDINKKNKSLWEEISEELKKNGVFFNAKACETKLKNLKRSYVACVDHNKVSGNDRKKCNFYDELHEIFSKDDAIAPKTLCSNIDGKRSKDAVKSVKNSSSTLRSTGSDTEEPVVTEAKKKKLPERKKREDLVGLFKEFTQDRKEEEKEKIKKFENMHNERMALMGRFLNVFEKSLNKE